MKSLRKKFAKDKRKNGREKPRTVHELAAAGALEDLKQLLAADPEQVELLDANNRTALHHAIAGGQRECVACLLAWGTDVSVADKWDRTPLYEAVLAGDAVMVRILLQAGAEAYTKHGHNQGQNALHIAVLAVCRASTKKAVGSSGGQVNVLDKTADYPAVVAELLNTRQYYADNYQLLFTPDDMGRTPIDDAKAAYKAAKERAGIASKSKKAKKKSKSSSSTSIATDIAAAQDMALNRSSSGTSSSGISRRKLPERAVLQTLRQAKAQHTLSMANTTLNVLLHGWNDQLKDWQSIEAELSRELRQPACLFAYNSLKDKVDIPSLALEMHNFLITSIRKYPHVENVNLICFSTGGLILRTFLATYYRKHYRTYIKRLVMLAPANMGSPFAKMGKERIGKMWVGQKKLTSLFESGQQLLTSLEPSSPFLWDLAHKDALAPAEEQIYAPQEILTTVVQGTRHYPKGIVSAVTRGCMRGTDGTVTVSGGSMRILKVDLNYSDQSTGSVVDRSTQVTRSTTDVALRHHPAHTHRSLIDSLAGKGDVFFLVKHALLVTADSFPTYKEQLEAVNERVYSETHEPGDLLVFRYEGNARPITRMEVLVYPDHHKVKFGAGIAPYMQAIRSKNIVGGVTSKFGPAEYHSRSRNMFYQLVDTDLVAEEMRKLKRQQPGSEVALALCLKGHSGGRIIASTAWPDPFPHVQRDSTTLISLSPLEELELRRGPDEMDFADEITAEISKRGSLMNMRSFRIMQKLKADDSIDDTVQHIGARGVLQTIEQTIRDKVHRELLLLFMDRVEELSTISRLLVLRALVPYFHLTDCKEMAAYILCSSTGRLLAELKEQLDVGEDSARFNLHKLVFGLLDKVPFDLLAERDVGKKYLIGTDAKGKTLVDLSAMCQEHVASESAKLRSEEVASVKLLLTLEDTLVATQLDTRFEAGKVAPGMDVLLREVCSVDDVHCVVVCEQKADFAVEVPHVRLPYVREAGADDSTVAASMLQLFKQFTTLYPECQILLVANGGGAHFRFLEQAVASLPADRVEGALIRDLGTCNSAYYNTSKAKAAAGTYRTFFTAIGAALVLYDSGLLKQQHLVSVATEAVQTMEQMPTCSIDRWGEVLSDLSCLQQQITSSMNSRQKTMNLQSLTTLFRITERFETIMAEKKLAAATV